MTERFIIDTAGTLIDMTNRNTYDYVTDICPLLNELNNENTRIKQTITEAYNNERTDLGKSVLKQLLNSLE